MSRTITVKGVGRVSTPPDYIVISMSLEAQDTNYEKAMEQAALQIDYLNKALESVGFKKKSVKTVNFNVRTDYERVKDRHKAAGAVPFRNLKMSCQTRAVHRLHSKRPVCGQQEAFEIRNDQRTGKSGNSLRSLECGAGRSARHRL